MTIAAWEYWAVANMLITTHGDAAEEKAQFRIAEARESANPAETLVWTAILDKIAQIRADTVSKGGIIMKLFLTALAFLAVAAPSVSEARDYSRSYQTHHHSSSEYYTARSGHRVRRPTQSARAPSGASARCGDGSWSFSESRRGTCSHHGGVGRWL
jgi:hypothetical protein